MYKSNEYVGVVSLSKVGVKYGEYVILFEIFRYFSVKLKSELGRPLELKQRNSRIKILIFMFFSLCTFIGKLFIYLFVYFYFCFHIITYYTV